MILNNLSSIKKRSHFWTKMLLYFWVCFTFVIYLKFKRFSKKSLWFHLISNFTMQLYLRSRLFVSLLLLLCTVWFDAVCYFNLILAVLSIMYLEPFCQNSQLTSPTYMSSFPALNIHTLHRLPLFFPLPITTISCGSFVCRPVAMYICRAAINLFDPCCIC